MSFRDLRWLYGRLPPELHEVAGRAVQIVEWDRSHQFCGACGAPTRESARASARASASAAASRTTRASRRR